MMDAKTNYFLLYATANDERLYLQDILNLYSICHHNPEVDKIYLYIAISQVNKPNFLDAIFIEKVSEKMANHPFVVLKEVFFKNNVGRDFSSYASMYKKAMSKSSNDYFFFQNRSARGPFKEGWYSQFINQFKKHANVALCGNTINMFDLTDRNIFPHIQSHAFISNTSSIDQIINDFPGINETNRVDIITKGEIALSQTFIEKGFQITSLNEDKIAIGKDITDEIKSQTNINPHHLISTELPYYHSGQIRTIKSIKKSVRVPKLDALKWFFLR